MSPSLCKCHPSSWNVPCVPGMLLLTHHCLAEGLPPPSSLSGTFCPSIRQNRRSLIAMFMLLVCFIFSYRTAHCPRSSVSKESACSAGDPGSIPRLGRSPGEGNGNPLWYSCLENPMDRGAWRATVHGVTRVGHDLASKPPPAHCPCMWSVVEGCPHFALCW